MQRRYLSIHFSTLNEPPSERSLIALSLFCKRYTPLVSVDAPLGLLLDTTGCEALFGGERALLLQIKETFLAKGFKVQVALAPTAWCARAMARHKADAIVLERDLPHALYALPIEALELDVKHTEALHALGIRRLLELFRLPRAQLLLRFGKDLMNRIDEIRGDKKDPRHFLAEVREWSVEETLNDTARDSAYLCEVVHTLLQRLCIALSKEGLGLQKLEMQLTHFDRKNTQMTLNLIKPTADVQKLFKLLKLKLDNFDAGLGIEFIQIKAPKTKPLEPREADGDLSSLFDTLLNRVGPGNLFRHALVQSHIPEQRYKSVQVGNGNSVDRPSGTLGHAMRLLSTPESIDVIAMMPDSPPRKIVWRRHFVFDVIKADGPERIEEEWWKEQGTQTRDYYRVENSKGLRLWVFKHITAEDSAPKWYLHGLLA